MNLRVYSRYSTYDRMQDGTKEEKLKMREAEDKALRNINVNPFK